MKETWDIASRAQLEDVMREILDVSTKQDTEGAVVLALSGDLGAGKTTFVQTLAAALGVEEVVTSPTFVVMKQYPIEHEVFTELVHIDAYRIESVDEMRVLGFGTLCAKKRTIICIEWAERIKELLPLDTIHLTFTHTANERSLTLTKHGN